MLDLFDQNGHLTDEALQALIREEDLDELQRLEISEHLSFLRCMHSPLHGSFMRRCFAVAACTAVRRDYEKRSEKKNGDCCYAVLLRFLLRPALHWFSGGAGFSLFPAKGSTEVSGRNKLYRQV